VDTLWHLIHAASGGRARPRRPPSPERLRDLADAIASRRYRVPPHEIAGALLGVHEHPWVEDPLGVQGRLAGS
jgi:hypothetical protein